MAAAAAAARCSGSASSSRCGCPGGAAAAPVAVLGSGAAGSRWRWRLRGGEAGVWAVKRGQGRRRECGGVWGTLGERGGLRRRAAAPVAEL